MLILRCDLCKRLIPDVRTAYSVYTGKYVDRMTCEPDKIELCENCMKDLKSFLKDRKEA